MTLAQRPVRSLSSYTRSYLPSFFFHLRGRSDELLEEKKRERERERVEVDYSSNTVTTAREKKREVCLITISLERELFI